MTFEIKINVLLSKCIQISHGQTSYYFKEGLEIFFSNYSKI